MLERMMETTDLNVTSAPAWPQRRLIVTRHAGAAAFIEAHLPGFRGATWAVDAKPDDVRSAVVAGNLPLALACLAAEVWVVEFTGTPPRGREYTMEQMEAAGAVLRRYVVRQQPGTFPVRDAEA